MSASPSVGDANASDGNSHGSYSDTDGDEGGQSGVNPTVEVADAAQPQNPPPPNPALDNSIGAGNNATTHQKKGLSVAHKDWVDKRCVFIHCDVEHGGKDCGMLQISAVAVDPYTKQTLGEFDEYVRPPPGTKWTDEMERASLESHKLKGLPYKDKRRLTYL